MKRRREQAVGTPDLGPATAAVLLHGWCHRPPPNLPPGEPTADDRYLELYSDDGLTLWCEHESRLRARAFEWGWEATFMLGGVPMFYAEYLANGGEEETC